MKYENSIRTASFVSAILILMRSLTGTAGEFPEPVDKIPIDRHALVTRHNIQWDDVAGQIPLGNGEFCFNADGTGLQTFGGNSMSHWGWHSFPLPAGWTPDQVPPTGTFQQGRNQGPDHFRPNTEEIRKWMFDNPHVMNLGRLRLCRSNGAELKSNDVSGLTRMLDLWSGLQTSSYQIDGQPVRVETCVHPTLDAVVVRIESPLIASGELQVALDFPYPSLQNGSWVGDFFRRKGHSTEMLLRGESRADLVRQVDATTCYASLAWSTGCQFTSSTNEGRGNILIQKAEFGTRDRWADVTEKIAANVANGDTAITPDIKWLGDPFYGQVKRLKLKFVRDGVIQTAEVRENESFPIGNGIPLYHFVLSAQGTNRLEFICAFSPAPVSITLPTVQSSFEETSSHWKHFWSTGGAIDLSGSKDPRWFELERRIVLSQYQLAAQSAGSWPSAEAGLMGIDPWRGQFHMEMIWWHLAHYALWDRWAMADKAIACYQRFVPSARALAAQLGYAGLKWPKSVGPEGRSAPWIGNQVLLWKQPHPIFFAELDYRLHPTRATLEKWSEIVFGTAEHMADYPTLDAKTGIYSLAFDMPPSEKAIWSDTVFDLAYWRWGLDQAQVWRERLSLARNAHWDDVRNHLAPMPVSDGVFVDYAGCTNTYTRTAWEHPDPIGAFGMLPPLEGVDAETAHRTVLKVWATWNWDKTWGWDLPWMAMAAARTGEPQIAVDALLKPSARNQFDQRGVNTGGPCPYLPGNGGLLYAVAMMTAGWDHGPNRPAPGFPSDGSWTVKWEGLKKAP
ncbi:MAG TPA: hypothetical protein VFW05_09565 [Verrucomicrobiae bacterium]|nr:hypothetical protein [Verrucomicrobiae bacterium]